MQAASVDFNAEQFLQTDIAEMNLPAEMIQQGKLAWLGRGFEHDPVEPERLDKPFGIGRIQVSILIEESDTHRAFASFDDELDRPRIEPFLSLVNPCRERVGGESSVVLLPELHLNGEAATPGRGDNVPWMEWGLGESLAAF